MAAAVKNADKVHNMDTPGSGYSGVRPHKAFYRQAFKRKGQTPVRKNEDS